MPETKKCEVCDAEIGKSETACPACKINFEELEGEVTVVTRAQVVADKRKKAAAPPTPTPEPATEPAKKSVFASLNRKKG